MSSVRARLVPGLLCGLAVLVGLHLSVGLSPLGWLVGASFEAAVVVLLARGLSRTGARGPHPGDQVTLVRAGLVGGVAALAAGPRDVDGRATVLVAVAAVALALDAVDGRVARRTQSQSTVGARFDMEVDAFLILVLSGYVARELGAWVLLIGLARYLLLVAGHRWPWLRRPTPPRQWAKVVAAVQGIVLTLVASDALPRPVEIALLVGALALLVESFSHQVRWLAREHAREPAASAPTGPRWVGAGGSMTVVALLVLWLAMAMPDRLDRLTPGLLLQIPVEGVVLAAAALVLTPRPRRILSAVVGSVLGLVVLLKALDMGYYAQLNRAFNPVVEWSGLSSGLGVLSDSLGPAQAVLAAAGAALLAVAVVAATVWASLRVTREGAAHRRRCAVLVGLLAVGWVTSAAVGVDVAPDTPVASRFTTSFVAAQVRSVSAAAGERRRFAALLAAADPHRTAPVDDLLRGLDGKDVIIAFVESYGRSAVSGSTFAPGIVSVLDAGAQELDAAGISSRSAFLTSPTFGGVSWLAHATLQSGLRIDNQQSYQQLLDSSRLTLSGAFEKAGWRTVGDAPANSEPWPEGKAFYGFDELYDATNTGYRGPRFSYATMPDQYTLSAFRRLELTPGHAPVMAEIDLVSSHIPWTPLPRLVDWREIGDGSLYAPMAAQGPTAADVYRDDDALKAAYGRSIEYSLASLISFVQLVDDDDLVLVLLGDHQPSPRVSGPDASNDVPISIVTRDATVLDRISPWRWTPGLRPGEDAPVWPMEAFRDRFLDAFSTSS